MGQEGEKVILQKGDIMQIQRKKVKAIWNQNAEFWDCAMGMNQNDFHREVVPKVTELLNPDPTDYIFRYCLWKWKVFCISCRKSCLCFGF